MAQVHCPVGIKLLFHWFPSDSEPNLIATLSTINCCLEQTPVEREANIHPKHNTEVYTKGESKGKFHRRTGIEGTEGSWGMVQLCI